MAMRADSELMVITKAKDLVKYVLVISENAPKKFRFSLVSKMQNNALDVLESLILANEILLGSDENNNIKRRNFQQTAIAKLKVLDALAMNYSLNSMPKHRYFPLKTVLNFSAFISI